MAAVSQVSNWADTTIIIYILSMLNGEPAELENCVSTTRGREAGRAAEIKLFDFISFYWRGRQGGADLCFERK